MSKIKWEKVDKENCKKTVTEELEDHKYLNMRTPYEIDQAANQFIQVSTEQLKHAQLIENQNSDVRKGYAGHQN